MRTCWIAVGLPECPCPLANRGWDIETFSFDLTKCPATLTGSYQDHYGNGTEFESGTYTGTQILGGRPCSGKAVLSGTVRKRKCVPNGYDTDGTRSNGCYLVVIPADGEQLEMSGPGGSSHATTTNKSGHYRFDVKPGSYPIHVAGPKGTAEPASQVSVHAVANASVESLDFSVCKEPHADVETGEFDAHHPCDLVEIDGSVLDIDDQPYTYASVLALGRGYAHDGYVCEFCRINDVARIGATGTFTLFAPRGQETMEVTDFYGGNEEFPVSATRDVNVLAPYKLLPFVLHANRGAKLHARQGRGPADLVLCCPYRELESCDQRESRSRSANSGGATTRRPCRSRASRRTDMTLNSKPSPTAPAAGLKAPAARSKIRSCSPASFSSFCPGSYTGTLVNSLGEPVLSLSTRFTVPQS